MDDFSTAALRARESEEAFERFVNANKSYILGCASRCLKRFVRDTDDEWSVALIAFSEAVRVYDPAKGEFAGFSAIVIKRRLMDEERRRIAYDVEIPVGPDALSGEIVDDEEGEDDERIAGRIKHSGGMESRETAGSTPLQDEISAIQSILGEYGFSFYDLTECSPRSRKTKEACKNAVKLLLEKENLFEKMQRGRNLPIRELCDKSGLSRKLIDRHRRYIIAVVEILKGDFPMLGEYIKE